MRRTLLSLLAIVSLAANPALSNAEELSYEDLANEASQDTANGDIEINETNFPDAKFRNWILSQSYGKDSVLTEEEIAGVSSINVSYRRPPLNISSLKGIEYFTALTTLDCSYNQLTTLDLSKNTALTTLKCYSNQLTSLDVSNCTALTRLDCSSNQLTSLDVSKNTALDWLSCSSNRLTSLDASNCTALTTLGCYSNQLTSLDVSNTALTTLSCNKNHIYGNAMDEFISSLPYNSSNKTYEFYVLSPPGYDERNVCTKSQAAAIKAKGWIPYYWDGSSWNVYEDDESDPNAINISFINFPDKNFRNWILRQGYGRDAKLTEDEIQSITSINVDEMNIFTLKGIEFFTSLKTLSCDANLLNSLDVSKNTALKSLRCWSNQLTSLDVSQNTALESLNCIYNELTSLDVSQNTALESLDCSSNQLTSLDVSQNTALTWLECYSNHLTSLDVSKNTALGELRCYNYQLTSLDLSKNTALDYLDCHSNQLTSLDVSQNPSLRTFYCHRNQINGKAMDNLITSLPYNSSDYKYSFYVIAPSFIDEGNVCTKSQVAAVKAKGWIPYYRVINDWLEYEGSEDYQYAQGDVNGDGEVGIGDIVTVANVMASNETDADVIRRADVNGDGKVGIGDIISITNIMAGE